MRKRILLSTICASAMIANNLLAAGVNAQEREKKEEKPQAAIELKSPPAKKANLDDPAMAVARFSLLGPPGDSFMLSEMSNFDFKVVKGAPFSADAVTEFTQVLADGNRIVRTNSGGIYRDGEGRTRREQSYSPFQGSAENVEMNRSIMISDPVGNNNYSLQPHFRTAYKTPRIQNADDISNARSATLRSYLKTSEDTKNAGVSANVSQNDSMKDSPAAPPRIMRLPDGSANRSGQLSAVAIPMIVPASAAIRFPAIPGVPNGEQKKESLGKQMVEGVEAEGIRLVNTIPAGAIGNDRPIEIVYERWYSPELQVVVLAKQSDPRAGETVYRLTNINRSEPDSSLFQVPSDYTVHEPQKLDPGTREIEFRKKNEK